jgi:hypothetical protein
MKLSTAIILISIALLAACDKGSKGSDAAKPDASEESTPVITPEVVTNDSPVTESDIGKQTDAISQLAMLSDANLSVDSSKLSSVLANYFKDGCTAGSEPLTFEQTCQHYSEDASDKDPSPWPDLMVAISSKELASAVLFKPEQSLGDNWQCDSSKDLENVRYCYPKKITAENRARWSKEWAAFFAAAD